MTASRQELPPDAAGRVNQKRRTRSAIIAAAQAIVERGETPTVAQAANDALVSRTTAYRYFPTQESLLLELSINIDVREVEDLAAQPLDGTRPRTACWNSSTCSTATRWPTRGCTAPAPALHGPVARGGTHRRQPRLHA